MPVLAYASHLVTTIPATDPTPEQARQDLRVFKDLAWDFARADLARPLRLVEGVDAILQNAWARLGFFLGEWFLDLREGVPYYERILIHHPDQRICESILRRAVLTTPGVSSVAEISSTWDRSTRVFEITRFVLVLADGSTVIWPKEGQPTQPFIVTGG